MDERSKRSTRRSSNNSQRYAVVNVMPLTSQP